MVDYNINMKNTIQRNLIEHNEVFDQLYSLEPQISDIAALLIEVLNNGNTIFWCGNGGSASDSQHLAGELIGRFKGNRKPLKSISLNSDSAVMTCIVNDYGYEHIFSRQIEALGEEGDVLIGISTSGRSENVNNALKKAKEKNLHTVGFLGKDGGAALQIASHTIVVPSQSTARIQEMHITIGHILCELIEEGLGINS
jgi:D-sedoheptulose 7-phosphate isomerase|tara:strand:+ start:821 stop:1414 length:594 start_codon:yes stop_codon:yes gene_type:complete